MNRVLGRQAPGSRRPSAIRTHRASFPLLARGAGGQTLRPEMQTSLMPVRRVEPLSGGCFVLEVEGAVPITAPGQFFMLRPEQPWPVLLPRPFSLFDRSAGGRGGSF